MQFDADRLERALVEGIVGVTSPDEVFAAVCVALREALGDRVLVSIYVADEERLWLSAQRGYDQVVHTHSPGAGLYSRAFAEARPVAVACSVSTDPTYIEVVRGIESLAAAPFTSHVSGIVGIESRAQLDELTGIAIVEAAATTIQTALDRLAESGDPIRSGRLRLLRAVSALATCKDPNAIVELLARSVGDSLGLDLVQVAPVEDGRLEPRIVWSRTGDRSLQLDPDGFRDQAARFAHELVIGSEEGLATIVGIPLRAAGERHGYLIGASRALATFAHERIDEALVAATTAAQSLAAVARAHELRRSREAVRTSEESLERLLVSVDEHVFSLERTADERLRVVRGRDALVEVLGSDPANGVEPATRWLEAIHPDDRPKVEIALAAGLAGGTVDLEHRLVVGDDGARTHRLRGQFRVEHGRTLFEAIVTDITEHRRAEHGRVRAEQRYHAVVESLFEGLVVLDLDGKIVSANASAQRILGREDDNLIGREASWFLVDETGATIAADELPGAATLRDGEPRTGVVLALRLPGGEQRWIEENTRALRAPDGELEAVVVTFADVTERAQAEQ
ncbi:MAG: PAS domain S-box protein, partial [Gaiellales bacterium]